MDEKNIMPLKPKKEHVRYDAKKIISIASPFFLIVLIIAAFLLVVGGIKVEAKSLRNSFSETLSSEKKSIYDDFYDKAYKAAAEKYHISNRADITVRNLEEVQKLEILKVNETVILTENGNANKSGLTSWTEVEGEGTFIINLKAAEFIIDNQRSHILVRLPAPELTNISTCKATNILFDSKKIIPPKFKEGVDLAIKQQNEARVEIQKSLMSNQYVLDNAKKVGESIVSNLIKQFNPGVPKLSIDVEYMN